MAQFIYLLDSSEQFQVFVCIWVCMWYVWCDLIIRRKFISSESQWTFISLWNLFIKLNRRSLWMWMEVIEKELRGYLLFICKVLEEIAWFMVLSILQCSRLSHLHHNDQLWMIKDKYFAYIHQNTCVVAFYY